MGKTHLTFRLSDEAISVILQHQADLAAGSQKEIDRTDALEDILFKFANKPAFRISRLFHRKDLVKYNEPDPKTKSLEAFTTA